ncbi:MAG: Y-family DNA polymerase [Burkholderiales bacterium]
MLWIAVTLPRLPLEVFLRGSPSTEREPRIVADAHIVRVANDVALAKGVRPGMALAAAYALAPTMHVKKQEPQREIEAIERLAAWAGQFTPSVSLENQAGLLLEVSGSLSLFDGLEPIMTQLRAGIIALGFTASIACAPTARAAWWLASSGKETIVRDQACIEAKLAALSIYTLGWSSEQLAMLTAIGTNTLGEVIVLPRAGFARRFGRELLQELDQALGRAAEPRRFFTPPDQFEARLELPAAVEAASALLFAAKRLFTELAGFLAARASGVQSFDLMLEHDDQPATLMAFNLVAASRDEAHFTLLARERFERLALPAPVYAIALHAPVLTPVTGVNLTLFRDQSDTSADWTRLVERLRARLGVAAVHGLTMVAEHRPEYVVRPSEPGTVEPKLRFGERPLWLFAAPQPLIEIDAKPFLRGPLALVAGPERIESGWWDGNDVARDYFIAQDEDRSLLWVFRERSEARGWFLQGLFA